MFGIVQEVQTGHTPESLARQLPAGAGVVLLRSGQTLDAGGRYSFVAAEPFLTFRSSGACCDLWLPQQARRVFGHPWRVLDWLLARYELSNQPDLPFPLGGCFGYWGYDLKHALEPKLNRALLDDLELPEAHLGFYESLVVFDHLLGRTWVVASGLDPDGDHAAGTARRSLDRWRRRLETDHAHSLAAPEPWLARPGAGRPLRPLASSLSRDEFLSRVLRAQALIRSGDIYQVNLSHRLAAEWLGSGWDLFERLNAVSPAPFAAYLDAGDFQVVSSSPEMFLRLNGSHIRTRPIKGTRPRSPDPVRDAQLAYELQTSPKEMAELIMITDLLRNDLGRVCEFGSVQVPELIRLERYPQVQHLVSTIEGRLPRSVTHLDALAACFPGGSITGAPKFRAMQVIEELEPVARGPYTGALGYLGFNRESQLSIIIRTAICTGGKAYFPVGAGIVADSEPAFEYEETLAKARGFAEALALESPQPRARPAPGGLPAGQHR